MQSVMLSAGTVYKHLRQTGVDCDGVLAGNKSIEGGIYRSFKEYWGVSLFDAGIR